MKESTGLPVSRSYPDVSTIWRVPGYTCKGMARRVTFQARLDERLIQTRCWSRDAMQLRGAARWAETRQDMTEAPLVGSVGVV